jgi:cytidylate kinase
LIITIGGHHGAGRTTTAKLLAQRAGLKYIGVGQFVRQAAQQRGMDIESFQSFLEKNIEYDKDIDRRWMKEAERGECVVDANLAGKLAKKADLRVWLTAPLNVRAERRVKAARFGDRPLKSAAAAGKELSAREAKERARYKKMWKVVVDDLESYDLVLNTALWTPEQVVGIILEALRAESK